MGACGGKPKNKPKPDQSSPQQHEIKVESQNPIPSPAQQKGQQQPVPLQLVFENVPEPTINQNIECNKDQSNKIGVLQSINPGGQFDSKSLESMGNAMKFQYQQGQKNILDLNFQSNNKANLEGVWKNDEKQ